MPEDYPVDDPQALQAYIEELEHLVTHLKERLDKLYQERNYAAILAAQATQAYGGAPEALSTGWYIDEKVDDPDWATVVCMSGKNGQVSWHMSPTEANLAKEYLNPIAPNWDGTFLSRTSESLDIVDNPYLKK